MTENTKIHENPRQNSTYPAQIFKIQVGTPILVKFQRVTPSELEDILILEKYFFLSKKKYFWVTTRQSPLTGCSALLSVPKKQRVIESVRDGFLPL